MNELKQTSIEESTVKLTLENSVFALKGCNSGGRARRACVNLLNAVSPYLILWQANNGCQTA